MLLEILKLENVHRIVLYSSLGASLFSVVAQYVLGVPPCSLCMLSRGAHIVTIVVVLVVMFFKVRFISGGLLILCGITFLFSFYHLGVENKWWNEPGFCSSDILILPNAESINKEEQLERVREYVFNKKVKPHCNQVNWKIFGVSSTLWDFLISAGILWILSTAYILEVQRCQIKK